MKIQGISYTTNLFTNKNQNNFKKQQAPKINQVSSLPSFTGGSKSPLNVQAFEKIGGKLYYDSAKINGIPFNGELTTTFDGISTISSYSSGEKNYVYLKSSDPKENKGGILFKKIGSKDEDCGSKNIYYKSASKNREYIENYDEFGKLCQTELLQYDENNENVICSVLTTYDENGIDVIESKTVVAPAYADKTGYSEKITECKNGRIVRQIFKNKKGEEMSSEKSIVYFNKSGKPYKSEDKNVRFYTEGNEDSYYATASERFTSIKDNVSFDDHFATLDFSKGINQLRSHIYDEHPYTVRAVKGNEIIYYDGNTEEMYAKEQYKEGEEFPEVIENLEQKLTAKKSPLTMNAFSYAIFNEKGKKAASLLLSKRNPRVGFMPAMLELYEDDGTRSANVRFLPHDTRITTYFTDRTTIGRREKSIGRKLVLRNDYENKSLVKQTSYTETGRKRVVEINGNKAKESFYEKDSDKPYSVVYYENDIAQKELTFDENGSIKSTRIYEDGTYENCPEGQEIVRTLYLEGPSY